MRYLLSWLLILQNVVCSGISVAQSLSSPEQYCSKNPNEPKCIEYLGSKSQFYSRSGNSGLGRSSETDVARFAVFIHTGGGSNDLAKRISATLRTNAYLVRGVDDQVDEVGTAGIDYFTADDEQGAAKIADLVNREIATLISLRVKTRFQRVANPPGYIGVWLPTYVAQICVPKMPPNQTLGDRHFVFYRTNERSNAVQLYRRLKSNRWQSASGVQLIRSVSDNYLDTTPYIFQDATGHHFIVIAASAANEFTSSAVALTITDALGQAPETFQFDEIADYASSSIENIPFCE